MGTPVIGLAYEDKVPGFFDQIAAPQLCLPLESAAADIVARLEDAARRREAIGLELQRAVEQLRDEVEGYADVAAALAEQRSPRRQAEAMPRPDTRRAFVTSAT